MTAEPENLQQTYRRRFEGTLPYRDRVWQVLVTDFLAQYIPGSSTVLDLGCGYGQFINHVAAARRYAMDLNPAARSLVDPAVTFLEQDCSERWQLPESSLDVVFTSNFLEHLPDKGSVARTIREARRCLRPGGLFIAMGPNARVVPGAYWDFFDHHVALTERSLSEALEVNGLQVTTSIARFLPYTMVGKREYPAAFLRLYLRLKPAWRWFGGQFLVIARRTA